MVTETRPLAIVTGASSGIGLELARLCAERGFDLVIADDDDGIESVGAELRRGGAAVDALRTDLTTIAGVDAVVAATRGRPVTALLASAGHGLGLGFLDQGFSRIRDVVNTAVLGTLYLTHRIGRYMRAARDGRIL